MTTPPSTPPSLPQPQPARSESLPSLDWSGATLASVLPGVAERLRVPRYAGHDVLGLPEAARTVVVLVDGLGHDLLVRRSGHAPFLRSLLGTARRIPCGFPTTTATSMGTFGTGLPPGAHGLVGMQVLDPATGAPR